MRRRVALQPKPDPLRVERLEALLRIALAYEQARRPLPGGLRRELVFLSDLWGKHKIPACVVEAKKVLGRVGGPR